MCALVRACSEFQVHGSMCARPDLCDQLYVGAGVYLFPTIGMFKGAYMVVCASTIVKVRDKFSPVQIQYERKHSSTFTMLKHEIIRECGLTGLCLTRTFKRNFTNNPYILDRVIAAWCWNKTQWDMTKILLNSRYKITNVCRESGIFKKSFTKKARTRHRATNYWRQSPKLLAHPENESGCIITLERLNGKHKYIFMTYESHNLECIKQLCQK